MTATLPVILRSKEARPSSIVDEGRASLLLTFAFCLLLLSSILRRARGKVEVDGEARGFEVAEGDFAAQHAEEPVRDDEAELVHVRAALVRRVYVHGVEDSRGVFERLAPVGYLHAHARALLRRRVHAHAAARGAPPDGEGEEVVEHLTQLPLVGDDADDRRVGHAFELHVLLLRQARDGRAGLAQSLAQTELVQEQLRLPRFQTREVNELIQTRLKLEARRLNLPAEAPLRLGQVLLVEHYLREAEDGRERRA